MEKPRCQLDRLNGIFCKFPAKYRVELTGEVEGEDSTSTQTKTADVCGKHLNALREGAESGNYTVKVWMIPPERK